jgi:N-terminal acetyltransferase B complex non-catalytic subunit
LLEIYGSQNYDREALAVLDSPSLGPKSRIAQGEGSVLLSKLKFLQRSEKWEECLSFCRELLGSPIAVNGSREVNVSRASEKSDEWEVWKLLLTSTEKIVIDEYDIPIYSPWRRLTRKARINQATKEFVQSHINCEKPTRNCRLAYLNLIDGGVKLGRESQESLFKACKSFWLDYHNKLYCFSDLRPFVHHLDETHQKEFLPSLSDLDAEILSQVKLEALKVDDGERGETLSEGPESSAPEEKPSTQNGLYGVSKINELKFAYCFSIPIERSLDVKESMESFVCTCLSVYEQFLRTTKNDVSTASNPSVQSADDACLLAVMTLVRLDQAHATVETDKKTSVPYLLQAACLLELLLSKSPSNYQAQLLLARIQLLLGVGSLAMKTFSRLKIKYLQTDTTLHHLLTRISTIHPHAAPYEQGSRTDVKDRDPQEALKEALYVYRSTKAASLYGKNTGLDNGSYINVKDSIKLGHDLQFSFCRLMFALECRKIQRLYSPLGDDFFDVISKSPLYLVSHPLTESNCSRNSSLPPSRPPRLPRLPRVRTPL